MVEWQHALEKEWPALRFSEMKVETNQEQHAFEVQVYFNGLDPNAARIELYADGVNGGVPVRQEMELGAQLAGSPGGYTYRAQVPANRPATDYTARAIPHCDGVAIPLEEARIIWQR
jgi:starch phosphorylase